MKLSREFALASDSLLTLIAATPAAAQGAQPGDDSALGEPAGEIVVTARRREEDAQDVPLVVNAEPRKACQS